MKTRNTIVLWTLAILAVGFIAIYDPLTRSTREKANDSVVAVNVDPGRVEVVRIFTGDDEIEIKRHGNGWQMGPDFKDRADSATVAEVLKGLSEMVWFDRIEDSEIQETEDLKRYGLHKPKRRVEIVGPGKQTLLIGRPAAGDGRLYVRTEDSRNIYVVSDEVLKTVFRRPQDFRDKRLSDLDSSRIDRVVIRRNGGEMELVHESTGWKITKPLNAAADDKKVNVFLDGLLGLQIISFVAADTGELGAYGITEGDREISFYADGNPRAQTLRLGSQTANDRVKAQFTARDSVYELPEAASDLLAVTPDSLRDRRLLPLPIDYVDAVKISSADGTFTLRRKGEQWVVADAGSGVVRPGAVENLFAAVNTTEADKFLPAQGQVSQPVRTVTFLSHVSENTPETTAGDHVLATLEFGTPENGVANVQVSDAAQIAVVPETVLDAIPAKASDWVAPAGQ